MTMLPTGTGTTLPPKGGWRVGSQVQATRRTSNGQLVEGWEVHFLTGYGVSGSVFVPAATYDPATVRTAIAAKVRNLDAVAVLSSDGK